MGERGSRFAVAVMAFLSGHLAAVAMVTGGFSPEVGALTAAPLSAGSGFLAFIWVLTDDV